MGTDDKIDNKAEELGGKLKEGVGKATGDDELKAQGEGDQAKSNLKQAGENVKDAFKGWPAPPARGGATTGRAPSGVSVRISSGGSGPRNAGGGGSPGPGVRPGGIPLPAWRPGARRPAGPTATSRPRTGGPGAPARRWPRPARPPAAAARR